MTDEKYERVREKLDDALDRERTLRHALEWYIGSRFHAMNQTLCDHPICVRIQRADEPPGAGMLAFGGERVLYLAWCSRCGALLADGRWVLPATARQPDDETE